MLSRQVKVRQVEFHEIVSLNVIILILRIHDKTQTMNEIR